jgi:hypothetical protein
MLGYQALLGVVQATVSGIKNPLPPAFMRATQKVIGDSGIMTRVTGERRLAGTSTYGSPARVRGLREVARTPVKCISSFESQPIDPLVLHQLMALDKYEQDKGASVIAYQVKEFAKLQQNLRIASAIMMLANGVIYRDSNGTILPTTSGENTSLRISSGMAAAHQGQCDNGTSAIVSASWATQTTNIPQQLVNLQERAAMETGYEISLLFYGKRAATNVMNNDYTLEWLARNPGMNDSWVKNSGLIPQGLFGFTWVPMWLANFRNEEDDTSYAMWDQDLVVATPSIDNVSEMEEWWGCIEGSTLVPNSIDIVNTQNSLANCELKYGMGAYAQLSHNPVGLVNYQFDVFLHYIRNPDVIWQMDTVF